MQRYKHFKHGNEYFLFKTGYCAAENEFYAIYGRCGQAVEPLEEAYARHSETEEWYLVSEHGAVTPLMGGEGAINTGLWIRPIDMFFGYKEFPDGRMEKRFVRIE